ncbi:hypothetical protein MMC20_004277 [Loxospora ochrophaea]|nr:hypothetical protein [Loxospora ochrophaea]
MASKGSGLKRRIGLTADTLRYGNLLQNGPHVEKNKRPLRPVLDINAPPEDSSDESSLLHDAELSGLDSPPTPKRLGGTQIRVPRSYGANGGTSRNINPESSQRSTRSVTQQDDARKDFKRPREASEVSDRGQDPFDSFSLSKPKRPKSTYRAGSNIHASVAPLVKKAKTKSTQVPTHDLGNGFQAVDVEASLLKTEPKKTCSGYKNPLKKRCDGESDLNSSLRRSPRHTRKINRDASPPPLRVPPSPPAETKSLSHSSSGSDFKTPLIIPGELDISAPQNNAKTFRMPPNTAAVDKTSPRPLSQSSTDGFKTLQIPVPPPSSAPTSSMLSTSFSLDDDPPSPTSSLSSPPLSPTLSSHSLPPPPSLCPVCQAPIPPTLLQSFFSTHRPRAFTTLAQTRFCRYHAQNSAKHLWSSRHYPSIDWATLPSRCTTHHHPFLSDIICGRIPSFYAAQLADRTRSGRHRTLQQSMLADDDDDPAQAWSTGYYGPRGARVMMENVMDAFAGLLRRQAAGDKLIGAAGVSGYVQAVLVPELAVRLVMEDLGIEEEERARKVLGESWEVGELLCEEVGERIVEREEDKDEEGREEEEAHV